MKKTALTLLVAAFGLVINAGAGEAPAAVSSKNPKNPPQIEVPALCDCFNPGPVLSLYGAAIIPDGDMDDGLGGGLSLAYFATENFGLEIDATWLDNDSTIHNFSASAVFRAPIKSACIAPYVLVGGGVETDSVTQGTFHAGGGIDIRLSKSNCAGIFADARYTWADETDNYVLIRAGFRINL